MVTILFPKRAAAMLAISLLAVAPAMAERPMNIVGSTYVEPYVQSVVNKLVAEGAIPAPTSVHGGTAAGVAKFCSASGTEGPDVVAMSRRMRRGEFETCKEHGVDRIIEIQLGTSALAVVGLKRDPEFKLSLEDLYKAVAAEIPRDNEFLRNQATNWNAIDPRLPNLPIRVLIPAVGLGSRGFFEDRFLEAACRKFPDIKNIYSATERVRQCLALRRDGRIVEIGLPFAQNLRSQLSRAQPGTVAIVPLTVANDMLDLVNILPLDGETPTPVAIADLKYEFVRPLYVYVNRDRVKAYNGEGPVVGLREFITELTREETIGTGGYLEKEGLSPLREDRRRAIRDAALSLRLVKR